MFSLFLTSFQANQRADPEDDLEAGHVQNENGSNIQTPLCSCSRVLPGAWALVVSPWTTLVQTADWLVP